MSTDGNRGGIRGVFRFEGRPAAETTPGRMLIEENREAVRALGEGRILVKAAGPRAESVSAAGIDCVLVGRLHEAERLARELGVSAQGDAELLALAFREHGKGVLARLRGRFSFLLWDGVEGRGLLGTDLLATQPVFVSRGTDHLTFAGEIPDLLGLSPSAPGPDRVGFLSWLGGWTLPADRTLYDGISRVPPGTVVELGRGAVRREYWRPVYREPASGSADELAAGLLEAVEAAVRRRSGSGADAVILSGGLDSSVVTAVTDRVGADPRVYSAVFPGAEYDEEWKVRSIAAKLGIESKRFELAPQGALWSHLSHLRQWGLPLMGAGALIDVESVRAASEDGVEAVLDGQTGDELFGFSPWVIADRVRRGRLLAALRIGERWAGRPLTARERFNLLKHWGVRGAASPAVHRLARRRRDPGEVAPSWLHPEAGRDFADSVDQWQWKSFGKGPAWWRYQADLLVHAPHRELRLEYLRNRASSLGVRDESPLYDPDLIEFCLRLPPTQMVDPSFNRPLARRAMDGILPDDVRLHAKKANFSPFCYEILTVGDAPGLGRLLDGSSKQELAAYADPEAIRGLWAEGAPGRGPGYATTSWGTDVWRLAAAESWLRSLADPDYAAEEMAREDVLRPSFKRTVQAG